MTDDKPPKEIFLQFDGEEVDGLYGGTTWCQDQINESDVRYIRADCLGPPTVETLAHSLWTYGALSFKDESCDGYGLDDIPREQAEAFRELARNVIKEVYAHPEDAPGRPWWCHSAEGGWTLHCEEERGGFEEGIFLAESDCFSAETVGAVLDALNRDAARLKGK